MNKHLLKVGFLAGVYALLLGCVNNTQMPADAVVCEEPRSPMCTFDYRPVCATQQSGQTKTYSNGCGACADTAVKYFQAGACTNEG